MPYPFVRRAGVLALAATMLVPQAGCAFGRIELGAGGYHRGAAGRSDAFLS